MWPSVRAKFTTFTSGFEGRLTCMYCDILGLVTTGCGNLIDPIDAAVRLPWRDVMTDLEIEQAEIEQEFYAVKALGGNHPEQFWPARAKLVLASADIDSLVLEKLDQFEQELTARPCFAMFPTWPADAQLGLLSMAWAMGAAFQFPQFQAACMRQDFSTAAAQCKMDDSHNPGLTPRNRANVLLFGNGAAVLSGGLDKTNLYYPSALSRV